jgi:hypothetical protein
MPSGNLKGQGVREESLRQMARNFMAETERTKVCPLCAETIKAAAKVCPYCRKSQRGWASFKVYDLGALAAALFFIGAIFFNCLLAPNKKRLRPGQGQNQGDRPPFCQGYIDNQYGHIWDSNE